MLQLKCLKQLASASTNPSPKRLTDSLRVYKIFIYMRCLRKEWYHQKWNKQSNNNFYWKRQPAINRNTSTFLSRVKIFAPRQVSSFPVTQRRWWVYIVHPTSPAPHTIYGCTHGHQAAPGILRGAFLSWLPSRATNPITVESGGLKGTS